MRSCRLVGGHVDVEALEAGVELKSGEAKEGGRARLVTVRALQRLEDGLPLEILQVASGFFNRQLRMGLIGLARHLFMRSVIVADCAHYPGYTDHALLIGHHRRIAHALRPGHDCGRTDEGRR